MNDYIFFMHDDAPGEGRDADWSSYFERLRESGCFNGGSAVGGGVSLRKSGRSDEITAHIVGYVRITARTLEEAEKLVQGNPVFERGGTVEVRELPRTE